MATESSLQKDKVQTKQPLSITVKSIVRNVARLLRISWEVDPITTCIFFLVAFLGAMVPVLTSFLFTHVIDQIQGAQLSGAASVPILIVSVLSLRALIISLRDVLYNSYARMYLDHIYRYKLQNKISYDFYNKVVNFDIAYFEDADMQNLISKVKDMMLWRVPDYIRTFSYLFGNFITYVSAFVVSIQFGWWVPVLVTLVTLPRLYIQSQYGNVQWSIWDGNVPHARKLWYLGWVLQDKVAVREMRISQTHTTILNKFKSLQQHLFNENKKPLDQYMKVLIAPAFAEGLVVLLITFLFLPDAVSHVVSIGSFALLVNMLAQLNTETVHIAYNLSSLYENNLYVNQYFELFDVKPRISSNRGEKIQTKNPPRIEFKNVSFAYAGGPNILHNVSFVIEPGQSVAFVGHNGAGKSTIIKLLCRFYDATEGEILIDGKNIKDIDLHSWYSYLGTLFQEFVWYQLTVRENITLGTRRAGSDKEIIAAAKKAGAHDFIMKLPHTYDQQLGRQFDAGEELSGGQWQKLAIARAFYQQPQILILDEPTSAIDAEAEYEIFSNLEKHYSDEKSLILVSHRFSTVRNAEKIIVLEDGKISEQGTHHELMKLNKTYARLFTTQAKGYA